MLVDASSRCSRTCRGRTGASTATLRARRQRATRAPGSTRPSTRATTTSAATTGSSTRRAPRAIAAAATRPAPARASETRKPSRESAPPLFDLTSLQREGEPALRLVGAPHAARRAQRCYEAHKVLTYPRTDSRCLPERLPRDRGRGAAQAFAERARGDEASPTTRARRARLRERGLENDGAHLRRRRRLRPLRDHPDRRAAARRRSRGDDKRAVRPGRAPLPRRVPSARACGSASSARPRSRGRALPHARAHADGAGLARGARRRGRGGRRSAAARRWCAGASEASGVAVRALEAHSEAEETKPPARITEARLLSLMENAGQQHRGRGPRGGAAREGHRHARDARRHHREPDREGLRGARSARRCGPTVKGIRLIDTLRRIHIDRLTSPELTGEIE